MRFDPTWDEARKRLFQLAEDKRVSLASASQALGRNKAYLQQYLKRGTPAALAENERHILAKLFGVTADEFRGPRSAPQERPAGSLPLDVRLMRQAIISTLVALTEGGRSLDSIPPQDVARAILRTYELLSDHLAGGD